MQIKVQELVDSSVLAGRRHGQAVLVEIMELCGEYAGPLDLDLSGITHLTSSFFLGGMLPLWHREPALFPIVSNASELALAEISIALAAQGWAVWINEPSGEESEPQVLGPLATVYRDTPLLFTDGGRHGASGLSQRFPDVRQTAWNNRLAHLYRFRLLDRAKVGKTLDYFVPWRDAGALHG